jgi:pyruvate formate lyase activating enzyme
VRENRDGILYSLVYRRLIARHVDPIEKKPLFHFHPGSLAYSMATVGCNFQCVFCQNCDISQMPRDAGQIQGADITPETIVDDARAAGCISISYTYTEPTIYFEYAYDTMQLARAAGIKNTWVSNGYMTPEAVDKMTPFLDAINVDLKGFQPETYRRLAKAKLEGVIETLQLFRPRDIWLEITTLIIPGINDSEAEMCQIAEFVASLGTEVPWHVSRFHPDYRMHDRPATPPGTLFRAVEIAKAAGLKYVFSGNLPGDSNEHTYCPGCGKRVIERTGFSVGTVDVKDGACRFCGETIDGVGM